MDETLLSSSLQFCQDNGYLPVFLGTPPEGEAAAESLSIGAADAPQGTSPSIPVLDNRSEGTSNSAENAILLLDRAHLGHLSAYIEDLLERHARVNLVLEQLPEWDDGDLARYEAQLRQVAETTRRHYETGHRVEINVLTDLWYLTERCDCGAGENSFTLAPNGKIYLCPAFYFADPNDTVGSLEAGIQVPAPRLLHADNSPYCRACDVYSCRRCKFLNKHLTGEIGIPSRIQCLVSHLERTVAMQLQHALVSSGLLRPARPLGPVWYSEPLELVASQNRSRG